MFWIQIIVSFAIWILGGVFLARKSDPSQRISRLPRTTRVLSAGGLMIACLALLFLPLNAIVTKGGLSGGPMSIAIWLTVTLAGALFVLANTVSMAILVALAREAAVTKEPRLSSTHQDLEP